MAALYDRIGRTYGTHRHPDPRIAAAIRTALGSARTVVNVGAGTGSYEPEDLAVTAVEPSRAMIDQRRRRAALVVQARAEALPFADGAFDAAMAVLTVHHWEDAGRGLRELRRVARGPVAILTFDPDWRGFWLADYIPALDRIDVGKAPQIAEYERHLGPVRIAPVPVPHDCRDGFLCAFWQRPEAYLDPEVRKGISTFWQIGDVTEGIGRLASDIATGRWAERYGALLGQETYEAGYRLVVTT